MFKASNFKLMSCFALRTLALTGEDAVGLTIMQLQSGFNKGIQVTAETTGNTSGTRR